jgi:hypothetical protein
MSLLSKNLLEGRLIEGNRTFRPAKGRAARIDGFYVGGSNVPLAKCDGKRYSRLP